MNVSLKDITFPGTEKKVSGGVHYWMELLKPSTAHVLASYHHPHWGGYAAITHNHYQKGTATYAGCYFDVSVLKELLRFLCREAGIELPPEQYPVIVKRGINDFGEEVIYYFNYSDDAQNIIYHGRDGTLLMQETDITDGESITLKGWDFCILCLPPQS